MKVLIIVLFICVFVGVLGAGCTAPVTQPATTVPTTIPATPVPTTAPITDPALVGTWYLKGITQAGGANPMQTMNVQITAVFTADGLVGGSGNCNTYSGPYTLTGQMTQNGKGITIGPLTISPTVCVGADKTTQQSYLTILENAASYTINTNQQLTITGNDGSLLVLSPTPYGATSVPIGS